MSNQGNAQFLPRIGLVHYNVADLDTQVRFYGGILGFKVIDKQSKTATLGTEAMPLLQLTQIEDATRVTGTTGLYHTAFLVPTRYHLAELTRELLRHEVRISGTSNHGTHLAIYLSDPEGNGIELAWDFPKEEWPYRNGNIDLLSISRKGVDMDELFYELTENPMPWAGLHPDSVIGHVHLRVANLKQTESFYHDLLGFDVILSQERLGALFVSKDGYHHHIGNNIWHSEGAPPPPSNAIGLRYFTVFVDSEGELKQLADRAKELEIDVQDVSGPEFAGVEKGVLLKDPAQNGVVLTTRPS